MLRNRMKTLLIATSFLGLAACAGEVVDIDRTQPNRVDKSIFEGEWYFRPVVLQTQFNQGLLFEGLNGNLERIRWEIREDTLTAYRSYEMLEGAEEDSSSDGGEFEGSPVASFRILSHFDVMRNYNEATGEQSNVLVENTTDRPWFERDYMRVDWSQNLISEPYGLAGGVQALAGAPYYVQEHEVDNPHRAEITETNINIVNNYVLRNDFDTCQGVYGDPYWCGRSNAKMKLSFMKVGDRQYEPLPYPDGVDVLDERTGKPIKIDFYGNRCDQPSDEMPRAEFCNDLQLPMFSRFGFFRTERRRFDDEFQFTQDGRIFLANRYNIWERSYDSQGNTIPMEYREPGEVVFYTNPDFPNDELVRTSGEIANEWDRAFRKTVAAVKETDVANVDSIFKLQVNDCNVDGVTEFADANGFSENLREYGISEVNRSNLKRACAVLEHVSDGDFTWQKPGDVRHSFMHWVDAPQVAGPLGYGPSGSDPKTGEIISANAYIYGASIDTYAAYAADVVSLMNGKLELDGVVDGEVIRQHIQRSESTSFGRFNPGRLANLAQQVGEAAEQIPAAQDAQAFVGDAKLRKVMGTSLERELLLNDELKRAMLGPDQYQPGQPSTSSLGANNTPSPLKWTADGVAKRQRKAFRKLAKDSIMMSHWSDGGMVHLAEQLKDKDWEEVYRWMRREIYRGVMAHEVGHTIGLRHNFAASNDALNYHPEFWDWYDPEDREVLKYNPETGKPTISERVMYSSIMDYDARFYADSTMGLGPYDEAAVKFGYGQVIEAFDDGVVGDTRLVDPTEGLPDGEGGEFIWDTTRGWLEYYLDRADYTELPLVFNGDLTLNSRGFSGQAKPENLWKRHDVQFDELYQQVTDLYNGREPDKMIAAVPYKFCTDEESFSTAVECQPYDKGANMTEIVEDRIERYDNYYFFRNFKRDRLQFNDQGYVNRHLSSLINRFFQPITAMFQSYLFRGRYFENTTRGDDWIAASMAGLNFLVSVLNQPAPGPHCKGVRGVDGQGDPIEGDDQTYYQWTGSQSQYESVCDEEDRLDVPLGVGKYYYTNWTDEYYYKATVLGSFWDKYAALWALTANQGNFYRDFSNFMDEGAFSLSYWIGGMEQRMLEVFSEAWRGKTSSFSWRVSQGGDEPQFSYTPVEPGVVANPPAESLPKIDSASSWTLQYYGVMLPMARFNSLYDYTPDFSWFTRVCLKGYQDCVSYDAEGGVTEFTDPFSGYTYVAPNNNPDNPSQPADNALGAVMLERAQTFLEEEYQPAKLAYEVAVDDGASAEDLAQKKQTLGEKERQLNELISFIDVIREMAFTMQYGTGG